MRAEQEAGERERIELEDVKPIYVWNPAANTDSFPRVPPDRD